MGLFELYRNGSETDKMKVRLTLSRRSLENMVDKLEAADARIKYLMECNDNLRNQVADLKK